MKVRCQKCNHRFDYHMYVGLCPNCGKIYRLPWELHHDQQTGITLNATYADEDIHPEQEEYFNHTHSSTGAYIPGSITSLSTGRPTANQNVRPTANQNVRPTANQNIWQTPPQQRTTLNKSSSANNNQNNNSQSFAKGCLTSIIIIIFFIYWFIAQFLDHF